MHSVFIQIKEVVVEYFDIVVSKDGIQVNLNTPLEPMTLPEYIEKWRRRIWEQGFGPFLKGGKGFKKSDVFSNVEGLDTVVRRLLFRCDKEC